VQLITLKEKYIPLLLSHQIGGITTIVDTHTLGGIEKIQESKNELIKTK